MWTNNFESSAVKLVVKLNVEVVNVLCCVTMISFVIQVAFIVLNNMNFETLLIENLFLTLMAV